MLILCPANFETLWVSLLLLVTLPVGFIGGVVLLFCIIVDVTRREADARNTNSNFLEFENTPEAIER
jgi:hypothetical protein